MLALKKMFLAALVVLGSSLHVFAQSGWTSQQATIAIVPNQIQSGLSLRISGYQLFATLPNSMLSQKIHAVIYSVQGDKRIEVYSRSDKTGITLSLNSLTSGQYFFEVGDLNSRLVQPFNIVR